MLSDDLAKAGIRLQKANRERLAAMNQIKELVAEGKKAGISITQMAILSGVTRQTIYTVLEEQE